MEELKTQAEKLTEHVRDYLETYYKLTVVNVTEKASNISAGSFLALALCILGGLVLFFLGLGAAWWIGNAINNRVGGYFIVAGFFILLMAFLFVFRNKLIFPFIRDIIVRKFYD